MGRNGSKQTKLGVSFGSRHVLGYDATDPGRSPAFASASLPASAAHTRGRRLMVASG